MLTRIAPSPTGDPHVGTAYQALYDYVWARKNGGRFIVRIEDTDQKRYDRESEQKILELFSWLGLPYAEGPDVGGPNGPYRQSERLELYRHHADQLVRAGHAYRSFETPEELEGIRRELLEKGIRAGYDGRGRAIHISESDQRAAAGEPHVIRFKSPKEGHTVVQDGLRGAVEFENAGLEDSILLKTDGFPTYHLAVVVDDHLMGISDVIRGEEWLPSAPIHVLLYRAFGWQEPNWYHISLLLDPEGGKLSKRKGNASMNRYREMGILPQALLNYLGHMGWSYPDGREVFSVEEMARAFSWERVGLGGSTFDFAKLKWLNGKYIREVLSLEELVEQVKPFVDKAGYTYADDTYLKQVLEAMRIRFETLQEFVEKAIYFFRDDYPVSEKAQEKLAEGQAFLAELRRKLAALPDLSQENAEPLLRAFAAEKGLKIGAVMQPLRAALTGTLESPGMFELLQLLGKERVLARIDRVL
jgi:glutamyl-tRNA synthetase